MTPRILIIASCVGMPSLGVMNAMSRERLLGLSWSVVSVKEFLNPHITELSVFLKDVRLKTETGAQNAKTATSWTLTRANASKENVHKTTLNSKPTLVIPTASKTALTTSTGTKHTSPVLTASSLLTIASNATQERKIPINKPAQPAEKGSTLPTQE